MENLSIKNPSIHFNENIAIFLDVDGTILNFSNSPKDVKVDQYLLSLLKNLEISLNGALALVSGRSIKDLDNLFSPLKFNAGGQHGLELRKSGEKNKQTVNTKEFQLIKNKIHKFVFNNKDIFLEDKGSSIAIHYRMAPDKKNDIKNFISDIIQNRSDLHLIEGKMVFEIKDKRFDKGKLISLLMQNSPFKNKLPIFLGDDLTDEDGFKLVNSLAGISIKVGSFRKTNANFFLSNVSDVNDWLYKVLCGIRENE